jgi:2Fe-2S ferredoxin
MVTVHLVAADGTRHAIRGTEGDSLMRAATGAGVDEIAAICGGCLTCATCHVFVDPAWVGRLPRRAESRLSCQITLAPALDGLVASLPQQQY